MRIVNIHEAKTHLSRLAADGEPFIIAKAGKPLVRVIPYAEKPVKPKRIGCMPDLDVPDDFDRLAENEIAVLFAGENGEIPA